MDADYYFDILRSTRAYEYSTLYHPNDRLISSKDLQSEYKGENIRLLDKPIDRRPWQNTLLNFFYDESKERFLQSDDRSIYWVQDEIGTTGKSKFVKWLCINRPKEVVKIIYGSPSQLRSAVIGAGVRRLYIIDLPRTSGKDDSLDNILSVVEDIKNGHIVSNMYGRHSQLLMDPPHILIFSNQSCPTKKLSDDRWQIYRINKKTFCLEQLKVNQTKKD
jgi:hypothetical protein